MFLVEPRRSSAGGGPWRSPGVLALVIYRVILLVCCKLYIIGYGHQYDSVPVICLVVTTLLELVVPVCCASYIWN